MTKCFSCACLSDPENKNMIFLSCKLSCLATRDQPDDPKDKNLSVQMHVELPQVWTPVHLKIFIRILTMGHSHQIHQTGSPKLLVHGKTIQSIPSIPMQKML